MLGEDNRLLRHKSKFADKKVDLIFEKFDLDRDDSLSLDEFVSGCLRDEYLSHLLNSSLAIGESKTSLAAKGSNEALNNQERVAKEEIKDKFPLNYFEKIKIF